MTSIHAALVRLNVASQKISFWEVQLENTIKRAEFLDDFDAKQISKEKKATISELSNFERSIRAGTRALLLRKRFANLSQSTTEIINSQLSIRSNDRVNFEDLDLDKDDQRQVLRDAEPPHFYWSMFLFRYFGLGATLWFTLGVLLPKARPDFIN